MLPPNSPLSDISWIYSTDGSLVLPVIYNFDVISGKNLHIGIGNNALNLPKNEEKTLSNMPYNERHKALMEKIALLKGISQDQLKTCTSSKMLFETLNLDNHGSHFPELIESARDYKNLYTIQLMYDFRVASIRNLDRLPQSLRSRISSRKYWMEYEYTKQVRLCEEEIECFTDHIQSELQSKNAEQDTPEA